MAAEKQMTPNEAAAEERSKILRFIRAEQKKATPSAVEGSVYVVLGKVIKMIQKRAERVGNTPGGWGNAAKKKKPSNTKGIPK